jgi:hypothetical protein
MFIPRRASLSTFAVSANPILSTAISAPSVLFNVYLPESSITLFVWMTFQQPSLRITVPPVMGMERRRPLGVLPNLSPRGSVTRRVKAGRRRGIWTF